MPKHGCPEWEYENHPNRATVFSQRIRDLLVQIYSSNLDVRSTCSDTRPVHRNLFQGLTPANHDYYAGHYRGECKCLIDYEVCISDDPLVATPSVMVPHEMARFSKVLVKRLDSLQKIMEKLPVLHDPSDRIVISVRLACQAFVELLTIHPYANGNGHTARTLLLTILANFGFAVQSWPIDPRPAFPEYPALIAAHRRGNVDLLEQHIISLIAVIRT